MGVRALRLGLGLAAAVILLAVPLANELASSGGAGWAPPVTPSDRSPGGTAKWWRFLDLAREHLPEGVSFTVIASDSASEMGLFMIAMGLFPDHQILPTSYYGNPVPELGGRAEYVLAFGVTPPDGKLELVASLSDGAVFRRVVAAQ